MQELRWLCKGQTTTFFADILCWAADSLEANRLGGWNGNMTCRHCHVSLSRVREGAAPQKAPLRTMSDYIRALEMDKRQRGAAIAQGIQARSFLCSLPGFDVINQIGQDHLMHDEMEGTLFTYTCVRDILYTFIACIYSLNYC